MLIRDGSFFSLFFVIWGAQERSAEEQLERELLIRRLQAELRTEEMKLVLLKKIRQTQILAQQQQQQQQQQQHLQQHMNLTITPAIDVKSGTVSLLFLVPVVFLFC